MGDGKELNARKGSNGSCYSVFFEQNLLTVKYLQLGLLGQRHSKFSNQTQAFQAHHGQVCPFRAKDLYWKCVYARRAVWEQIQCYGNKRYAGSLLFN